MYAHPTYAVSTSREPLSVLNAWMGGRQVEGRRWLPFGCEREPALDRRLSVPLAEMAGQLPHTRLVYVVDHESDIMALMVRARDLDVACARSGHTRGLVAALQT